MKQFPKQLLFAAIFVGVALYMTLPIFVQQVYLQWQVWVPISMWLIGGATGFVMLEFDRVVDVFISHPDTKLATVVKEYFGRSEWKKAWAIIMHNKHLQQKLTFRSALFQVIWIALAYFTVTSTGTMFGIGFVMGLGLHLLLEEWEEFLTDKQKLKKWLFWQVNREVSDKELKIYMGAMTVIYAWLLLVIV